jgi:peptide/nickel transport system ATP-binding protein
MSPLVEVADLVKNYPLKTGLFATLTGGTRVAHAVSGVSLDIEAGEIVGVVGESGSGKTTLGKVLTRLEEATDGDVRFDGRPLADFHGADRRAFHRSVQMIFQDPYDTLNPRLTIFGNVELPLRYLGIGAGAADRRRKVMEALELVELNPADQFATRYPHQLSGGQRQRVAIARALIVEPRFLVADEPVSMLDVSIRAGVLNLLKRLNTQLGVAVMLITHDLTTAYYLSHRIAVMYLGKIVELGSAQSLIGDPVHPYTRLLLASAPDLLGNAGTRAPLSGETANAIAPPKGCRFAPRCPLALDLCRTTEPALLPVDSDREAACHRAPELLHRESVPSPSEQQQHAVPGIEPANREGPHP